MRVVRVVVALWLVLVMMPSPAVEAIPVYDSANHIENISQKLNIIRSLIELVQQVGLMLDDLQKLEDPSWRDIETVLADIDGIVQSGQAIGYSSDGVMEIYRAHFPAAWAIGIDNESMLDLYPYWASVSRDTYAGALGAMAASVQDDRAFEEVLDALQEIANLAYGRDSNAQAQMLLTGAVIEELRKLNRAAASQVNVAAVEYGRRITMESSAIMTAIGIVMYDGWDETPSLYAAYEPIEVFP